MANMTTTKVDGDPFFELIPHSQWNACIGRQGNEQNYIDGYIEAAIQLASAVIDNQMVGSRDTLVLPILYNGRHALELSLKFAINKLHAMNALASGAQMDHDILSHWKHLRRGRVGDRTVRELVAELGPYVTSLARVDDDGQELRYAKNKSAKTSLANFAVVSLCVIRSSLEAMAKVLTALKFRVLDLEEERRTSSYTGDCSRHDLVNITNMLGPRSDWKNDSFTEAKKAVMSYYDISSRKFSKAVDKILASRQLAAMVGSESCLTNLSDEKTVFVMRQWARLHPAREAFGGVLLSDNFDPKAAGMATHGRVEQEVHDALVNALTLEEISDLEVLFHIGRERVFGEFYDDLLEKKVQENQAYPRTGDVVNHLIVKTNLLECVANGCNIVGRPSLAAELMKLRPSASTI